MRTLAPALLCGFLVSCGPKPAIAIDTPQGGSAIKGEIAVTGWAAAASGVRSVTIYIDGKKIADASLGINRPDVVHARPEFKPGMVSGWKAVINASSLPVGGHYLSVEAKANHGAGDEAAVGIVVAK